jgi:hypothetical protein
MAKALVWLGGDWESPGYGAALAWLEGHAECRHVNTSAAGEAVDVAPAAVVIAQSRPGEFSKGEVEQLQAVGRGCPVVVLAGSWCEGELRSGTPLSGVTRIEWRRWRCGFEAELAPPLQRADERQQTQYSLPPEAQLIARNLRAVRRTKAEFDAAVVCTESLPLYESLADSLGQFRIRARRAAGGSDLLATVKLILYDGWPQFERMNGSLPTATARTLLLLDWPRASDAERVRIAGIHEIISLPFLLSDLATAIST